MGCMAAPPFGIGSGSIRGFVRYLTLDPHRHRHFYQNQELLNVTEEQEQEEEEKAQIDFHGFHQNHRQFHHNQEIPSPQLGVFHGGLSFNPSRTPSEKKRSYLFLSGDNQNDALEEEEEYAPNLPEKMGENYQYQLHQHQEIHQQQQEQKATRPSRLGLRNSGGGGGGGEIVEVQGGHIVRSTGRKDRHSKVCTAKGPRDRRVRLSAHTAIQFYDVQDRLGYDRPSKAVDWLIKKAKTAIDELAELPAWKPTGAVNPNSATIMSFEQNPNGENVNHHLEEHPDEDIVDNQIGNAQNSNFLAQSLDNTIKSFFPMGGGGSSTPPPENINSSAMQFHHSFPPSELLSRPINQNQDLKLSLQSFQDPIFHHRQPPHHHHHHQGDNNNNNNNSMFFDGSGWPENQSGGFQRLVAWGGGGGDGGNTGFVFEGTPSVQQHITSGSCVDRPTGVVFRLGGDRSTSNVSFSSPVFHARV
ncbi:hypothetical protein L6452_00406 [Arctium lappa]|uniref:Uncharacterized protein n=1 Tax=Arctium lappa TaxID=4217 RepID=A0ACB9FDT0_ARCLA|nr:hypothetical protein L6452_00406 [Arctium lappa]